MLELLEKINEEQRKLGNDLYALERRGKATQAALSTP